MPAAATTQILSSSRLGQVVSRRVDGSDMEKLVAVELTCGCRPQYVALKHQLESKRAFGRRLDAREREQLTAVLKRHRDEVNAKASILIGLAEKADAQLNNGCAVQLYREYLAFSLGSYQTWECLDDQSRKRVFAVVSRVEMLQHEMEEIARCTSASPALSPASNPASSPALSPDSDNVTAGDDDTLTCADCGFQHQVRGRMWRFCGHCGSLNPRVES